MRTAHALLLIPGRPRRVSSLRSADDQTGLADWGLRGGDPPEVVVTDDLDSVPVGAPAAVVVGDPRPPGMLTRHGFTLARYTVRRRPSGEQTIAPRRPLGIDPRVIRRRAERATPVTVAARRQPVPAAVEAARPGGVVRSLVVSGDPRRRAAFLVAPGAGQRAAWVVKAAVGPDASARADVEQAHLERLGRLGLGARMPRALGWGDLDGLAWSVESIAPGVPLPRARRWWWRRHGIATLDLIGRWLGDLAAATAHRAPVGSRFDGRCTHLTPEAGAWLEPVAVAALGAPAVTVHGDLASGTNLFVRRRSFTVIDWETCGEEGLPLVDLLPVLAMGAARAAGLRDPHAQAGYVIELCAGRSPESRWLFGHVRSYLGRLGLALELAGPLAATAWAHHGSMRWHHDELVRTSGSVPVAWTSASELILERWTEDAHLGRRWQALLEASSAR